jgi:hypothetical protein
MAKGHIPRVNVINDDGTRTRGTPINAELVQQMYDSIEMRILSGNFVDVSVKSLIDTVMAGLPAALGGSMNLASTDIAYPAGAAYTALAPGSTPHQFDSALAIDGTYALEAVLATNNAAYAATLALVNLTDAPDTPIVEITSTSLTGAIVRSAAITPATGFGIAGTPKVYGVKLKTANAAARAKAWGIRLIRVS